MPDRSAEEMMAASEALSLATNEEERKLAARDFVRIEKDHFDAIGVHRDESPILGRIISGCLLLTLVVLLVINLAQTGEVKDTANAVQDLQIGQVEAARETCQRGNKSRVTNVSNLEDDVETLKGQLNLWEAILAVSPPASLERSPPSVRTAFFDNLAKLRTGINHKEKAVTRTIASQASVAKHKGSPEVDCVSANPLPGEGPANP